MKTEVDTFRKLNLYKQALRFTHLVLLWTEKHQDEIDISECLEVRKLAMEIPIYVAKAAVEINVKNKYKKLNRSKQALQILLPLLREYGVDKSEKRMIVLSLDLLRLFNGYFGMLHRKKIVEGKG